ncbi:MAG TPA: SgcJ/EcaC family oxidoreductase [Ktedonobacterales bacterium]
MKDVSANYPARMSEDERAVRALYADLLRCWNSEDAARFASLFAEDGTIIIYDGTLLSGRAEIAAQFGTIFRRFDTPTFVQIVRKVRFISPDMAILYGAVGMYSLPQLLINPTLNAVQTLMAQRSQGEWRIAHFQNTRADFPGRPDLVAAMTRALQREADTHTHRMRG